MAGRSPLPPKTSPPRHLMPCPKTDTKRRGSARRRQSWNAENSRRSSTESISGSGTTPGNKSIKKIKALRTFRETGKGPEQKRDYLTKIAEGQQSNNGPGYVTKAPERKISQSKSPWALARTHKGSAAQKGRPAGAGASGTAITEHQSGDTDSGRPLRTVHPQNKNQCPQAPCTPTNDYICKGLDPNELSVSTTRCTQPSGPKRGQNSYEDVLRWPRTPHHTALRLDVNWGSKSARGRHSQG